jgi:hypothetical protein
MDSTKKMEFEIDGWWQQISRCHRGWMERERDRSTIHPHPIRPLQRWHCENEMVIDAEEKLLMDGEAMC